ncbi:MAG: type II restriction endonuclease [Rhodobacterales bacterium RIFCSPHIGHO2_02_FULL_62_130]|nr:MAG: type II restriction endonuclease [Rhodobacterales bacterium RIFCSPHIGHO2_02_FULL_62_130]OHC59503.1 MAG: type II restriction endonuclease [Rhodobacterales bacterium RIFCSPHIGHO2_12_FULL_62_75]HCY99441.1 BREX-1 system adenine-specific DNA-methyltransferase PglX [Rhodobacter sp.]
MDTNALKKFAQSARNLLLGQVTAKLALVLDPASPARREHPAATKKLDAAITAKGKAQVIEQVAYTWFNRFTALRFMDVNGYTNPRVVSPADGQTRPEILAEAMAHNLPEGAPATIAALLDGRTPSNDPQAEAYRLLLVHACNQWHGPMPFLFEEIDDFTELLMPEDLLSPTSILAELRKAMTEDACQDVEVIGWLYQFYISEKKDQVFAGLKKNIKITAENIPAATQLFTPHWIVRYLVENSLGRLWLLNRPQSKLAERMDYYIAPEEPETDFLRITKPEDIRICDPAAGSGHMLTYAFDLLHAIYEEEGYEPTDIPAKILTNNLHGVEIDDRAGALAAFALVMKAAAKLGRRRFLRLGVQPNICVMQDVRFTAEDMRAVADMVGRDLFTADLRETLGQFEQAKNFGSLIVPKLRDAAKVTQVVKAKDYIQDGLLRDVQERVLKVLEMAEALSPKYHVVVANPPYAGASGLNPEVQRYAKENFVDSQADLFSMFMERGLALAKASGLVSIINMQSWMFISSFEKLRIKITENHAFLSLVQIGYNTFPEMNSKIAQGVAFCIRKGRNDHLGEYLDLNSAPQSADKEVVFRTCRSSGKIFRKRTSEFAAIPGAPIAYWASKPSVDAFVKFAPLSIELAARKGLATSDNERFLREWFEVGRSNFFTTAETRTQARQSGCKWFPLNKGGPVRKWYGNFDNVINWENDGWEIQNFKDEKGKLRSRPQNLDYSFRNALTWSKITSADFTARVSGCGGLFDDAGAIGFSPDRQKLMRILPVIGSKIGNHFLKIINPTLNFQIGDVGRVPVPSEGFDAEQLRSSECVSISKSDWDAYETSWDFTTLPLLAPEHRDQTLAGSYARLRAHGQGMTDDMQRLEEENNRIFIDAYGLQDELTPEVPLEEITLTCNPAYRYGGKATPDELETRLRADTIAEFLHYAVGCMFGRYSLDAPGLILANQGEGLADYLARVPEPSFDVDADNVIPVLDGDWFADDITERFRKFLRVTFGEAKFQENLAFIEAALGKDIRKWFTKDFFDYHVRRYKKRPIYWMFSSPKGTFNALIYMHRYRPDTVSVVLNDYLREFISKLQAERGRLEKLVDDPSAMQSQRVKAQKDVGAVIKQIAELEEWEREVVFPLAQAKIEIDLDDGVKRNYPLFGAALKPIKGLEAADE